MNIVYRTPPNWEKLVELFGAEWHRTLVTYGDTIYCHHEPTEDLIVHEETHSRQQGSEPGGWWDRYCEDPKFRLSQELEAYQNQYRFMRKIIKDKNRLMKYRDILAGYLAGPLYGRCVTHSEAFKLIGLSK